MGDKEFRDKIKKKRIRAIIVAVIVIGLAAFMLIDTDVEKADYTESLGKEIAKAEELLDSVGDNIGNDKGQYAEYTVLAFENNIAKAKAVYEEKDSAYHLEKNNYEEMKKFNSEFKKGTNSDVITAEEAAALKDSGESEEIEVEVKEKTKIKYTVKGSEIKNPVAMNFMAKEKGPYYAEINEMLAGLRLQGQTVSLYQTGSFGGKVHVNAPFYAEKETKAWAYKVDFEKDSLRYVSDAKVDVENQSVEFTVKEGGDYIVLTKKIHKDKKKPLKITEEEEKAEEEAKTEEETKAENKNDSGKTEGGAVDTPSAKPEKKEFDVTIEIRCDTLSNDLSNLVDPALEAYVPKDGTILPQTTVTVKEGDTVFDVLNRVCRDNKIQVESSYTPTYGSYYIEGINYLYEFDGGKLSGWMYKVNEQFPSYGCSSYPVKEGDTIVWLYTCDLGHDVGDNSMG